MTPDFDELVGDDLGSEERDRLLRAHELLVAAGPLPELPPSLAEPRAPYEEQPTPFFNRRRNATIAVLAAAVAAAAFGIGYLTGAAAAAATASRRRRRWSCTARRPPPQERSGRLRSATRTTQATGRCSSASRTCKAARECVLHALAVAQGTRGRAVRLLRRHGGDKTTEVRFTVSYKLKNFDGWVVTKQKRGQREPTRALLETA